MSDRAEIEISATTSRLAAGLRQARSMLSGFASTAAKGLGGAVSAINSKLKLGDVGKAAAGHVIGGISERGIDMIVDAAGEVRDFERNLIRYQITTNGSAASTAALRRQIAGVSQQTGIARDQILSGASGYVALTGDAQGAADAMTAFARISQASGASMEDIATATAALKTSMGLDAKDIEKVFSGMIVQGKTGAVELKDMAGQLATLAPQFANFRGGKSTAGIRELGSALQVVRTGAGSASEAATQLESLMGEISKPEVVRKLQQLKINIFDKDPKTGLVTMRNASDIFEDLAKNQKLSDPRVVAAIFGRKEAQQAIRSIRNHIDMYRDLKTAAEDSGAVQRDLDTFLESDAGRLDKAMNQLKLTIAEAFTPERIAKFTSAVENLVDKLGPVVDLIGKAGDALGGIAGVGKSVRGWLSGNSNSNPYAKNALDEQRLYLAANGTGGYFKDSAGNYVERNSEQGRREMEIARRELANKSGYDSAVSGILGAERNDRTTKESLALAAGGYYSVNGGASEASRRYLVAAGLGNSKTGAVDQAQVEEIVRGVMKATGQSFADDMQKAIVGALGGLKIDIPSDKVVNATRNSQKNLTRPR